MMAVVSNVSWVNTASQPASQQTVLRHRSVHTSRHWPAALNSPGAGRLVRPHWRSWCPRNDRAFAAPPPCRRWSRRPETRRHRRTSPSSSSSSGWAARCPSPSLSSASTVRSFSAWHPPSSSPLAWRFLSVSDGRYTLYCHYPDTARWGVGGDGTGGRVFRLKTCLTPKYRESERRQPRICSITSSLWGSREKMHNSCKQRCLGLT